MGLKKPKAIKRKEFKKDTDEQFVVVCNPFRQGQTGPWETVDTNTVAEWLRRALGSKTQCIHAVYTLGTREDIVVKIEQGQDLSKILGRHRWVDILHPDFVQMVIKTHRNALRDSYSDIYEYNFKYNGDPGANDARYPRKERTVYGYPPPSSFPVLRDGYPKPTWIRPPMDDNRLASLVLPLPAPKDSGASDRDRPIEIAEDPPQSSARLHPELDEKLTVKREKQDPYEADEAARAALSSPNIKHEGDAESKPKIEEPPPALIEALDRLKHGPLPKVEPKAEEEPPAILIEALSRLKPKSPSDRTDTTVQMGPVLGVKEEEDQKMPPKELLDALAALQSHANTNSVTSKVSEPRRSSIASQRSKRPTEDSLNEAVHFYKKTKQEPTY